MFREAILGTKAVTQTLGHLLKLFYYVVLLSAFTAELPIWIFPVVVCAAIAGNYLGSFVVVKMSDNQFKTIGRYVIMLIGVIYIGNGVFMLRGNL